MLDDYGGEQQVKRKFKTNIVVKLSCQEKGEYCIYPYPYTPVLANQLRMPVQNMGSAEIINERYITKGVK
jgi:hypothetical protein